VDEGFGRRERAAKDFCDFLIGKLPLPAKQQGHPLVFREIIQGFLNPAFEFGLKGHLGRTHGFDILNLPGGGLVALLIPGFEGVRRMPGTPADFVQAKVAHDGEKPGRKLGRRVVAMGGFEDLNEDVLGQVLRFRKVMEHPAGHINDRLLIALHQFPKCGGLAAIEPQHQFSVAVPLVRHPADPKQNRRGRKVALRPRRFPGRRLAAGSPREGFPRVAAGIPPEGCYSGPRMLTLLERIRASAAERLTLPGGRKPSEELHRYKTFLKVETQRLKIRHRAGASGADVCRARAAMLDALLKHLLEGLRATSPSLSAVAMPPLSLVATGGYGRAELNPFSDIDFMLLHGGALMPKGTPLPALSTLIDGLLHTLWDLGLKVGHSVRSLEDCVRVANQDMQSKTSLIEARLITGDEAVFERMRKMVAAKCVTGHEDEYIQARVLDQESRRAKFGNTPFLQEPNIKNGCGGLRDFQNLIWMTFFKHRTRSLVELRQKEMISEQERRQLDAAYDFLLRVRNELHYQALRAGDVLAKSAQALVALNLGYEERPPGARVEKFMRDYYSHARNIDFITRAAERRMALLPEPTLLPSLSRMLRNRRLRKQEQLVDGFRCVAGEIHPAASNVFREKPKRLMRVFLYAQQRGLKISPELARMIRGSLHLVDRAFLLDDHAHETFLEILNQRGSVAPILRSMHEVGLLGKYFPEFGRLTCLVQHEFYHQYTADEHTLVCLEKLDLAWTSKEPLFTGYGQLFAKIDRPFVLYLALLLHDSGKASHLRGHERLGADLAFRAARRLHLDGATTHTLRLVIENHLLMAQVSQRRDLEDPTVIRNFAGQIQSEGNLNLLTLHTFADSMGTSDQLWNSFKDALLWQLYRKAAHVLAGGEDFLDLEAKQRDLLAGEVGSLMPRSFGSDELNAHFSSLPPRYFQIHQAREILRDLALVHRFMHRQVAEKDEALAPVMAWHNEPDRGYTTLTICTWDRAGLFSKISASLTASGLNILGAEIITRDDGIIIDTFFVTDARTGLLASREEKDRFEEVIIAALNEETDLHALIRKEKPRAPLYRAWNGDRIPTTVRFDNGASATHTVVDIECEDRVGLLYDISEKMSEMGVNVALAKILTERGAAIDSFYVAEPDGSKITSQERIKAIEARLKEAIDRPARAGKG
jgi:[protein-PII] uridylyltransferase